MSGAPAALGGVMLAALVLYVLTGGADFGAGLWDLLARGPRAEAQRRLVERAIAPIWEANHVWLILIVVLLFSGFPAAYAAISTALHVPLTLLLVGIVARGSAFVFRQYSPPHAPERARFGRVFAVASALTPLFLGVCLGAISTGIRFEGGIPIEGFVGAWCKPFPLAVGGLALALFALLAAAYLFVEAEAEAPEAPGEAPAPALADDFRLRALFALGACALAAGAALFTARGGAPRLYDGLTTRALPLVAAAAVLAGALALALRAGRARLSRLLAGAVGTLIVLGWGLAQAPVLVGPDLTLDGAAGPSNVLTLLLVALGVGALALFPALGWLLRVFKRR